MNEIDAITTSLRMYDDGYNQALEDMAEILIFKEIADLAEKENVIIELKIGPDKAMSIIVYGKTTEWLTIGADWQQSTILDAVKDTIRRAKDD